MKECSQKFKRALAMMLAFVMVVSVLTVAPSTTAEAASKEVVKSLSGIAKTKTLEVGKTATIKAKVTATKKVAKSDLQVSVKSSKKSVVSVKVLKNPTKKAKTGTTQIKLVAKKKGTATITVTTKATDKKNKKVTKKMKVTVKKAAPKPEEVAVTAVNAKLVKDSIVVGEATAITASVVPENATNKTLTYQSSNPAVAAVNSQGIVTGIGSGEATITVKSNNGKTASVKIKVSAIDVKEVKLNQSSIEVTIANSTQLIETVLPENATDKKVTWSSKDSAIATVNQDGVITGKKAGQTEVYATASNGVRAVCKVKVVSNEVVADGIFVEVTNPYKDATGQVYENTTLVGDDITLRARVIVNGAPVGKDVVTLTLEEGIGGLADKYEVRQNSLTTDDDGYVRFAVGLKAAYSNTSAIYDSQNKFQSFTATVKESNSNKSASTVIKFATVQLNGITIDKENTVIVPSDNAAVGDKGTYSTTSQDDKKNQVYFTSQQTSKNGTDEHKVTLQAAPYLIIPAAFDSVREGSWSYKIPEADGVCGDFSVYNDNTNESTTVYVKDIPAGFSYLTLKFSKIDLSSYSKIDVTIYEKETGLPIGNKVIDLSRNCDAIEDGSIQIERQKDVESYLVVSLVTQGQVEASSTGYVLKEIVGKYQTNDVEPFIEEEIKGSVEWSDVQSDVTYETSEWNYGEAQKYLPTGSKYLNANYKYSYKVPVFPYAGDAIISVTDTNKEQFYFLYPTVNDNNNNILAPAPENKNALVAIYASKQAVGSFAGSLEQKGNDVVLNSTAPGRQFVKATIKVAGLDRNELSDQNSGELFSYVNWTPLPKTDEIIPNTEYFAIEGQKVVVKAKLFDINGSPVSVEGKTIKFSCEDTDEIKLAQGTAVGSYAAVESVSNPGTDANGEMTISFVDQTNQDTFSLIRGLKATADGYKVRLSFDGGKTYVPEDQVSDIYWVDLGLTFVDSALDKDSPVRTTQFMNNTKAIEKSSIYTVNKDSGWKIGYQVVGRTPVFQYSMGTPEVINRDEYQNQNKFISVSGVSVEYNADSKKANWKSEKDALYITNTVTGDIKVTGKIVIADPSKVEFKYYDEDGEIKTAKNIGQGNNLNVTNTVLQLNTVWKPNGITAKVLAPKVVCKTSASAVYVRVADIYNNPVLTAENDDPTEVTYKITGVNAIENGVAEPTGVSGMYKITLPKPADNMKENSSIISITVNGNDKLAENVTVMYAAKPTDGNGTPIDMGIASDQGTDYAVEVGEDNQTLKVYFLNTIEETTINPGEFTLTQNGTEVSYKIVKVVKTNDKCLTLTLDRAIEAPTTTHTLTVKSYEDVDGFVYELGDTAGQVIKSDSISFKPSERK